MKAFTLITMKDNIEDVRKRKVKGNLYRIVKK